MRIRYNAHLIDAKDEKGQQFIREAYQFADDFHAYQKKVLEAPGRINNCTHDDFAQFRQGRAPATLPADLENKTLSANSITRELEEFQKYRKDAIAKERP